MMKNLRSHLLRSEGEQNLEDLPGAHERRKIPKEIPQNLPLVVRRKETGNHANEDLEAVLPVMILMMVDQKRKWNQKEIKRGEDQGPLSNHQRNPVKRNLKKNPAQRILQVIQINFGWVDCCFHNRNKVFI